MPQRERGQWRALGGIHAGRWCALRAHGNEQTFAVPELSKPRRDLGDGKHLPNKAPRAPRLHPRPGLKRSPVTGHRPPTSSFFLAHEHRQSFLTTAFYLYLHYVGRNSRRRVYQRTLLR